MTFQKKLKLLIKNVTLFSGFVQSLENLENLENGLFLEKVKENLKTQGITVNLFETGKVNRLLNRLMNLYL